MNVCNGTDYGFTTRLVINIGYFLFDQPYLGFRVEDAVEPCGNIIIMIAVPLFCCESMRKYDTQSHKYAWFIGMKHTLGLIVHGYVTDIL